MGYQTVSLPFGSGVDTKTDPKMLSPPKLTLLQDCIFTNAQRLTKRPGYDAMTLNIVGGGTISNPKMVKSYRNELTLAGTGPNGNRLYSYSPALSAWSDRGKYNSIKVTKTIIDSPEQAIDNTTTINGISNPSCAVVGNIALYAFDNDDILSAGEGATFITVVDNSTGMHLADYLPVLASGSRANLGYSRAVLLGSSQLAVFYVSVATFTGGTYYTDAKVCFRLVTVTQGGGVVLGSEVIVGNTLTTGTINTNNLFYYGYDAVTTAAGALIAVCNEPNVDLYTVSSSGSVSGTASITSTGIIDPINVTLDPSGTNAWIYWGSANTDVYYAIYNASTLASVLGATHSATALVSVHQVTAVAISGTQQELYISQLTQPAASFLTAGVFLPTISKQSLNSSGTIGGLSQILSGADIYSKIFSVSGDNYIAVVTYSQNQSTGFILDLSDNLAVAKFLPLEAEGVYEIGANISTSGAYNPPTLLAVRIPSFLNSVVNTSGSVYSLCAAAVISYQTFIPETSNANAVYPTEATVGVIMGVASVGFDFNNIDAYQSLIQQDTLVLNGGIVSQYDSAIVSELGFNTDPDGLSAHVDAGTGTLAPGSYTYYALYRWTDANGNLHQSAPSTGMTVVVGSGAPTAIINLGFNFLTITQKQNVIVELYRTTNGGIIPYLVAVKGNSSGYVLFNDETADVNLINNPQLYTEGNGILENIAPPASMILWTNNNRIWAVDSENQETTVNYTKTASAGSGISFSAGELEVVVDSRYGIITGGSAMDEKTVIFKQNGVGYFIGDGANDSGAGSTITPFQFVPSDTGCSNSKSVILYPNGILFRATNSKGIYLFSRGVSIQYFGSNVSAFAGQDIQAAQITSSRNQIRFLTSSGVSLLYDYVMNQWSTFTNHTGLSSDVYNGMYIYVRTDGAIYQENLAGSYLDNGLSISPLVQLSWIKATSTQGFQRTRRVGILGDFRESNGGHGVQMSVAYDFQGQFSNPVPYIFSGADRPFQYRERLARQKCDAFQLLIQEITTGASGEYIDFSDLELEILAKTGINKMPRVQSVG